MRKLISVVVVVVSVSGGALNLAEARRATSAQPSPSEGDMSSSKNGNAKDTVHPCCKFCRKGKACGNSCIKRTYPCYQAAGCACDAH
jgi:hypothetical protein